MPLQIQFNPFYFFEHFPYVVTLVLSPFQFYTKQFLILHILSSASASWLVGTVVGHQYGWLRNGSTAASSARWLPDLSSGWEYRPLVRGEDSLSSWQSDDGTLRIESLRGTLGL